MKVYLVDPKPYHEFVMGIPMALAGLLRFDDLKMSFNYLKRVEHIRDEVVDVKESGLKLAGGEVIKGDYHVLAIGAFRIGDDIYSVDGAEAFYKAVEGAEAVRFIVDELYPAMGFNEISLAIKMLWPQKEVSIHLVYVHPDYLWLFNSFKDTFAKHGVVVTEEPPMVSNKREIHVLVPELSIHPLAKGAQSGDVVRDPVRPDLPHRGLLALEDRPSGYRLGRHMASLHRGASHNQRDKEGRCRCGGRRMDVYKGPR